MAENVIPGDLVDMEWSVDGVDGNFAVIKGCKTIGIPEVDQEYRDRTSLDSPGRFKEWGLGLKDGGEITLNCFYSTELYKQAAAYNAAGKPVFFRAKLPVRISELPDSDYAKSRTAVSVIPGQFGHGWLSTCCHVPV